jgi:hypothetical protein
MKTDHKALDEELSDLATVYHGKDLLVKIEMRKLHVMLEQLDAMRTANKLTRVSNKLTREANRLAKY